MIQAQFYLTPVRSLRKWDLQTRCQQLLCAVLFFFFAPYILANSGWACTAQAASLGTTYKSRKHSFSKNIFKNSSRLGVTRISFQEFSQSVNLGTSRG